MSALWDWLPPELQAEVIDILRAERRSAARVAETAAKFAARWDDAVLGVEDGEAAKGRVDTVAPSIRATARKQRGEARWNDLRVQAIDAALAHLGAEEAGETPEGT